MSQSGSYSKAITPGEYVQTLTGNTGGAVPANASGNINVVGDGTTITIEGNPGTNTLTASFIGSTSITIDGDSGSVSGSTITISGHNSSGSSLQGTLKTVASSSTTLNINVTDTGGNTVLGLNVAALNPIGNRFNTGLGENVLASANGCDQNTLVGFNCGFDITSGSTNCGFGYDCLTGVTTGGYNIAIGAQAATSYTSSESSNIIISNAGTLGESNTIRIGTQGSGNSEQDTCYIAGIVGNTVSDAEFVTINSSTGQLGVGTPSSGISTIDGDSGSVTGSTVTITGGSSGAVFTGSGTTLTESFNYLSMAATNSSGNGVISFGGVPIINAFTPSAQGNVFIGTSCGNTTMTGITNYTLGNQCMESLTSGGGNVAIGNLSNYAVTSGQLNLGIGYQCNFSVTTGSGNTSFGQQANLFGVSGSYNTVLGGYQSAINWTGSESSNVCINSSGVTGDNNVLRIGDSSGNNQISSAYIQGIYGVSVTGSAVLVDSSGQLGVTVSSRRWKENIEDMGSESSSVLKLRPVTFNYTYGSHLESGQRQFGLIAEEVEQVMPGLVNYDNDGLPVTVRYHEMPSILLNEIQKLEKRIAELEKKLSERAL